MERPGIPILLALAAVLAVTQAPRIVGAGAAAQEEAAEAVADAGTPPPAEPEAAAEPGEARPAWKQPLALLRGYFGGTAADGETAELADLVASAQRQGYVLDALVALVPDPLDSNLAFNFDQAVESIQGASAGRGYLLDRLWLPWTGDAAEERLYRSQPGALLLRRTDGELRLTLVLLVGETPKQGLHKAAFVAAASLAAELARRGGGGSALRILGPSFSGTTVSLGLALGAWKAGETAPPEVRIVSGTATKPGLEDYFSELGVDFSRTVVDDGTLQDWAFEFLESRMGWKANRIALFSEFDTAYGASGGDSHGDDRDDGGEAGHEGEPIRVRFPSGLASLRSAWARNEAAGGAAQGLAQAPLPLPKTSLDLRLTNQGEPVDVVPQFSTLSVAANDLALSNLMRSLWRGGTRYVGILATDVRDKLFLAERIRRFAPDMVLFTFDDNLLYAHPRYSSVLDGTLVFSSFPLVTESEAWKPLFGGPEDRYRRQFIGEFQQGVYLATEELLTGPASDGDRATPSPYAWISIVGNGSLWPLASAAPKDGIATLRGRVAATERAGYRELAGRADLTLLLAMGVLVLLAVWLWSVYPPAQLQRGTDRHDRTAGRLLACGTAALALFGAVLVVVGTLPLWRLDSGPAVGWQDNVYRSLFVAALLVGYAFLLWSVVRATGDNGGRRAAVSTTAGLLFLPLLAAVLQWLWMPGGRELFYLRARAPSSGLSPVVSLALVTLAFFVWTLMELKRRRLIARQAIAWPLRWALEPPLEGSTEIAAPLEAQLGRTLPPLRKAGPSGSEWAEGRWFWLMQALILLPPTVTLLRVVQPICETVAYGRLLLLAFVVVTALAAVSFHQFFALWLDLHRLLARLDRSRLLAAMGRIAKAVAWSPMRAFGWRLPNFKMLVLSAEWLEKLEPEREPALKDKLEAVFRADLAGDLAAETRARRDLNEVFSEAGHRLAQRADEDPVMEYFALRIVAFLGPVISHMRNCLSGAMLAALVLLFAVQAYAFEPHWFVSMGVWAALGVGVVLTLWVFVQMDRTATLSAIGGTEPGKLSFDRHLVANFLTYGALPVAGILITQFPQVGRLLAGWLNPVLRITGAQ